MKGSTRRRRNSFRISFHPTPTTVYCFSLVVAASSRSPARSYPPTRRVTREFVRARVRVRGVSEALAGLVRQALASVADDVGRPRGPRRPQFPGRLGPSRGVGFQIERAERGATRWRTARSEFAGKVERQRGRSKFDWTTGRDGKRQYYAEASCRQTECHIVLMYGQLKLLPLSSMSLMSVSIGVFPTSRTKNSCSITCEDTVLRDGSRSSSLPNLVG